MKRGLYIALMLAAVLFGAFPTAGNAGAAGVGELIITLPAEGATVQPPVAFDFYHNSAGGTYLITVEVAPGAGATEGFRVATWTPTLPDASGVIHGPLGTWDAEGYSGGPYTLRFTLLDAFTEAVVAQGTRTIILDAPDYSPVLALSAPAIATGRVQVSGSAQDTDLLGWRLEVVGADGTPQPLAMGYGSGVQAVWETGSLPDGPYTLRLTATDRVGNTAVASRAVVVQNPLPQVVADLAVGLEAGPATVDLTYTAAAPVSVSLSLQDPGGRELVWGMVRGPAGERTCLCRCPSA